MRFCGLGPGDAVPDANTLWDFREALIAAGALEALFARLDRAITEAGYLPMAGQIVDATLVAAPRQRNTEAEKARIKAGETARDIWPNKPAKARQKDTDARWTVKFSKARPHEDGTSQRDIAIPSFGYKSHISIDRRHRRSLRNALLSGRWADSLSLVTAVARRRWVSGGSDRAAWRRRCCRRVLAPIVGWNASPA